MSAQQKLGSACASAQSDQSLCYMGAEDSCPCLSIEHQAKVLSRLRGCVAYVVVQPNISVRSSVGFDVPWLR